MDEGATATADQSLLRELCAAASRLGLDVRVEPFDTPARRAGGLCSLRGSKLVLLDGHAPVRDRALALAGALATLDVDGIYVAPAARELIEQLQGRDGSGGGAPRAGDPS